MNAPMLIPLLALLVGILCAMLGAGALVGGILILVGCAAYVIFRVMAKNPIAAYKMRQFDFVWLALWFLGIGIISYDLRRPYESEALTEKAYHAAFGRISNIQNSTSGDRLTVDVFKLYGIDNKEYDCPNLKIILKSNAVTKNVDDLIIFPAKFSKIADSPDSFDDSYSSRMATHGFLYQCSANDGDIHLTGHSTTLSGLSNKLRDSIITSIEKSSLSIATRNFIITILLGDRSYLDSDLRSGFSDAGISHVLALSGMHIAIIASILLILLFPLNFKGWYKERLLIVGILLLFYAFISGMGYSTVRACIMYTCMIIGVWTERRNSAWNALLLAVFIILLFDPAAVYDVGLQLSFLCVASLIFFASPLNMVSHHDHPVLYKVNATIICTLVATFGSWAVTAFWFKSFPPTFIIANLIVLPILPIYLSIAIIYLLLSAVGLDIHFLSATLDYGFKALESLVQALNSVSGGYIYMDVPLWTPILWVAALALFAISFTAVKKRKLWFCLGTVAAITSITTAILCNDNECKYMVRCQGRVPAILAQQNGNQYELKFASNSLSYFTCNNQKVMALDCNIKSFNPTEPIDCDYLIITKSYTGTLEDLLTKIKPKQILLHPTMSRKREAILTTAADSLHLPAIPLRASSPHHQQMIISNKQQN